MKKGISTKQWIDAFVDWGLERKTWEQIEYEEGGYGKNFIKSVDEAIARPYSHPGRWFVSGQTDFSFYNDRAYVYSLMFGATKVSRAAYVMSQKMFGFEEVYDVGGSIFSSELMLRYGAKKVYITNFSDAPQIEFAKWAANRFDLNIEVVKKEDIKQGANVVMSEYLEHFFEPLEELKTVLERKPAVTVMSSSFCMPAYGHFIPIRIDGKDHTSRQGAARAFRKVSFPLFEKVERVHYFNGGFDVGFGTVSGAAQNT